MCLTTSCSQPTILRCCFLTPSSHGETARSSSRDALPEELKVHKHDNMEHHEQIQTTVTTSSSNVEVFINDGRAQSVGSFEELTCAQRKQLARDAWSIGLRAVSTAYAHAQEARLQDVGQTLLTDLDEQLRAHVEQQEKSIGVALGRYFDPESGQLTARLKHFLADDGTLANVLQRHLGADNSVLAESLAKQVGENSPLFKKLSPTESDGIVQLLGRKIQEVLEQEHQAFTRALDPLTEDSAVSRFLKKLRDELKKADDDQHEQLATALKALDANDPTSLMSQLRTENQKAREALLEAINPAAENSPLAMLKRTLTEMLDKHLKGQQETLDESREQQSRFEQEIRDAVSRIETRRTEQSRSSHGGTVFEDAVIELVQRQIGGHGYVVENTSNIVGLRPNRKTGDGTIRFPEEHAFAGASVVIEAKRDKSYGVGKALEELDLARANRSATAGIFVMARSHAPAGFPAFARYGSNVLVVWDDEDPSTDTYLHGALMVGLALVTRRKTNADAGDLQALEKIEQRVQKEVERLEIIRDAANKIRAQVETIEKQVGIGHKKLTKLVEDAKKTLVALNVELSEEAEERQSPIEVPVDRESGIELSTGSDS